MGSVTSEPAWKLIARKRREQHANSIPSAWRLPKIPQDFKSSLPIIEASGILSSHELEITATTSLPLLLQKLKNKVYSAEAVATAFSKRAALAQQLTGCLTETLFDSAIQHAKSLDTYLSSTGNLIGPLHGIAISLKDSQDIAGVDSTVGWVGLINKPAKEDNLLVKKLRELGAVVYCKTNIPQSLMMSDSYNHVFGQSVNALHRELISGGSSGGEGALIGARGSVLGIGTDIGGSIRIPGVLQGLYALSPSTGRAHNRESGRTAKYLVPPVAGPLASSLESLEWFMEAYVGGEPWREDPSMVAMPWRKELTELQPGRKLRVGYILDDGVVKCHPPIERAVREVVERLRKGGHEVFEWDCSTHRYAYFELWLKAVLADGGKKCADLCKLVNEPLIKGMLVGGPEDLLDVTQRQELAEKIWDYQYEYLKRWNELEVDALIAPVTPWVGMKPKVWVKSQQYVGYTTMYNLLNYAALTIPVTTVSRELDQPDDAWKAHKGRSFTDEFNHGLYDLELFEGMPVGVQIVGGRHWGEEKAIQVAKLIEHLKG